MVQRKKRAWRLTVLVIPVILEPASAVSIFKIGEHPREYCRPRQLFQLWSRSRTADQGLALLQGFIFGAAFFVHQKVDHVHRLAVCLTSRAEAIGCVRLVVHLQARGAFVVEGAVQPQVLVRFQPVVL
jgi:hypothetical protein